MVVDLTYHPFRCGTLKRTERVQLALIDVFLLPP